MIRRKGDYARMMDIFEDLTVEEWSSFIVTHPYMGGLPTFFYPAFQVDQPSVKDVDVEYGIEVPGSGVARGM